MLGYFYQLIENYTHMMGSCLSSILHLCTRNFPILFSCRQGKRQVTKNKKILENEQSIRIDVDSDIENFMNKELKGQINELIKANIPTHKKDILAKGFMHQIMNFHCFRCKHILAQTLDIISATSQKSKKDKDN